MKFLGLFDKATLSKRFFSLLGGLLVASGSLSAITYPLPTPVGGPVQLNPALTYPDPVLANLVLVMDNHYQPPYYPGNFSSPTYLENIYYLSNAYLGANLIFNPFDDRIIHVSIGQNQSIDQANIFYPVMVTTNTLATSQDGGSTWSYNPPPEQIIPLGGTISQLINASIGPGLFYEFGKDGRLYASGWGSFDMVSNPPHLDPLDSFLITSSENNGVSWSPVSVMWPSTADRWFNTAYFNRGPAGTRTFLQEFYVSVDPSNSQILHATTTLLAFAPLDAPPNVNLTGEILYFRSEDGGRSFSAPVVAYAVNGDEEWLAQLFSADYGRDAEYILSKGGVLSSAHPIVFDDNTILLPVSYVAPIKGVTQMPAREYQLTSIGVARSNDSGKTWEKTAHFIDENIPLSQFIYDPGFVEPFQPVLINGYESFGLFLENAGTLSRDAGSKGTVSSRTGRVYFARAGLVQNSPQSIKQKQSSSLFVSSSADKGITWTPYAQVNRTPTDLSLGARQAFSLGTAISDDGWYVAAYYDFRNWTGYPGEIYDNIDPTTAPPLPVDAWLAVYRETQDPLGGSTGIGLDFVGEIRLTPESFNARTVNLETAVPYLTPFVTSTPEGIVVAFNKDQELYVVYSTQSPGSPDNITVGDYKGMTVDTNGYYNLFLQRFKFPKPGNQ